MRSPWEWFRDVFVRPPSPVVDSVPQTVPDPDPPLPAHVMFCPKCAAERGSSWRYSYRPKQTVPLTENIFFLSGDLFPRQEILTVTLRDECVRVTCGCGYHWNEQTAAKIQGNDDPTMHPFPTFMQAWEWLLARAGHDEAFPLCDASALASMAQLAVASSEEGLALYVMAVEKLKEQGVLR